MYSIWLFLYPSNIEKPLLCHYKVLILTTCQWTCQTIRKGVQLTLKLKSAIHIFYWVMTSSPYWMITWTEILFCMITCMSRPPKSCCSDPPIRIATSTLLNMLRPTSLHPHVHFYSIIILPYMLVWLLPMTSSSSIYRMNWRSPVDFIVMKLFDWHILLASLTAKFYATVLYKQLRSNLLEVILTAVPMGIFSFSIHLIL